MEFVDIVSIFRELGSISIIVYLVWWATTKAVPIMTEMSEIVKTAASTTEILSNAVEGFSRNAIELISKMEMVTKSLDDRVLENRAAVLHALNVVYNECKQLRLDVQNLVIERNKANENMSTVTAQCDETYEILVKLSSDISEIRKTLEESP